MMRLLWVLVPALLIAAPAEAGPVAAAVGAIAGAIKGAMAASAIFAFAVNTALSIGFSLISQALNRPKKPREPGIQTTVTTAGGANPQSFILGFTATAGQMAAPPLSSGADNVYLHYPIEISDLAGCTVTGIIVNDRFSAIPGGADLRPPTGLGFPVVGFEPLVNLRYYDGTQVTADPMLWFQTSAGDRPWSTSHIGSGICYAIASFTYNRGLFTSLPSVRFVVAGIPLYDPRFDSSVGGSGAQRWANKATWAYTANLAVICYNIARGIEMPTGEIWGGGFGADDLPLGEWVTAMNACDTPTGGRGFQFHGGLEVRVSESPLDVMGELLTGCLGQVAETGGKLRIRVGAPAVPVLAITDDDILLEDQRFDPAPGLQGTHNFFTARYPEPASLWEARTMPPYTQAEWEAADDGRRLVTNLDFPAVPFVGQVAQLQAAMAQDHRRFRQHRIVLPPMAAALEPLDSIEWTSARFGYDAKVFEVVEVVDRGQTLEQEILLRERDPADYDWDTDPPDPPSADGLTVPAVGPVVGWSVAAGPVEDSASRARRAGLLLEWTVPAEGVFQRLAWQVRDATTAEVVRTGEAEIAAGGTLIFEGLLPDTDYEARARYLSDLRPTTWTAWAEATTDAVFTDTVDLAEQASTITGNAFTAAAVTVDHDPLELLPSALAQSVALSLAVGASAEVHGTVTVTATDIGTAASELTAFVSVSAVAPDTSETGLSGGFTFLAADGQTVSVTYLGVFTPAAAGAHEIRMTVGLLGPMFGASADFTDRRLIVNQFKR